VYGCQRVLSAIQKGDYYLISHSTSISFNTIFLNFLFNAVELFSIFVHTHNLSSLIYLKSVNFVPGVEGGRGVGGEDPNGEICNTSN
jgi:hypothetical protein